MRRSFHVAALPFPSPQGTQAAIAAMLSALAQHGDTPELLTYAHGTGALRDAPWVQHRLWNLPVDRSLRSGPSLTKVCLDVQLALRLRSFVARDAWLVAHHVEAAAAAWMSGRRFVFFAHTDMQQELPVYARSSAQRSLARVGHAIDRTLCRAAYGVAAISPLLAQTLSRSSERDVRYVPTPWPVLPVSSADDRHQARTQLGIAHDARVLLYAGNLDAYQGWQTLLATCAIVRREHPHSVLLVATCSDAALLLAHARAFGVGDSLVVTSLTSEADRARCHAAADLCVVPRLITGGLPIKLLDAMSRHVPIVTVERAIAGLPLHDVVAVSEDDSAAAIASQVDRVLRHADLADRMRDAGSAYLSREHSASKFLQCFDDICGG